MSAKEPDIGVLVHGHIVPIMSNGYCDVGACTWPPVASRYEHSVIVVTRVEKSERPLSGFMAHNNCAYYNIDFLKIDPVHLKMADNSWIEEHPKTRRSEALCEEHAKMLGGIVTHEWDESEVACESYLEGRTIL